MSFFLAGMAAAPLFRAVILLCPAGSGWSCTIDTAKFVLWTDAAAATPALCRSAGDAWLTRNSLAAEYGMEIDANDVVLVTCRPVP